MPISGSLPEVGELSSTADPKVRTLLSELKTAMGEQEGRQSALHWYEPKVIATEQTREATTFGKLATADEIAGVVLPTNGLIVIGYTAMVKSSVASAGVVSMFLGANQIKVDAGSAAPVVQFVGTSGTTFEHVATSQIGLTSTGVAYSGDVATGQIMGASTTQAAGTCVVYAAAGTYAVSVQYAATSGAVTAKERKLWLYTLGV